MTASAAASGDVDAAGSRSSGAPSVPASQAITSTPASALQIAAHARMDAGEPSALREDVHGRRTGARADRELGLRAAFHRRRPQNLATALASDSIRASSVVTEVCEWSATTITAWLVEEVLDSTPGRDELAERERRRARSIRSVASGPNLCEWWSLSGSEKSRKS